MVIDCHAHIHTGDDAEVEGILAAADRAGVDKLCVSSLSRSWAEFPTEAELQEAFDDIVRLCTARADRFIGFVYLSADHIDLSMKLMERGLTNGPCKGIKLWISQFADDSRLDPIYARAVELNVPVLQHTWMKATGNMLRESTCRHVVNAVRRHAGLKIWAAHASGRWEESARIVQDYPSVRLDISGGEPEHGVVDCLVKHIGAGRIHYGSDIPGRSFVVQMSKVLSAAISEDDKRRILGENVREWLHV